ncbi:MAG: CDP-alcohol phosphatidyltransferase family protein [Calditrichia bacterium]
MSITRQFNNPPDKIKFATIAYIWSTFHGGIILTATAFYFILGELWPPLLAGNLSFLVLLLLGFHYYFRQDSFGVANLLTLTRLLSIFLLMFYFDSLNNATLAAAGFLILLSDGLDGRLARRYRRTSLFGEYFDKETDAFFMYVLCLMIIERNLMGAWVVLLGAMRYLFALFIFFYHTEVRKERRSRFGRYVFVVVILALLSAFLPIPAVYAPLIILAAIILFYSFGRDIVWILLKR